jgi:lysozyme
MDSTQKEKMVKQLIMHEGIRLKPYRCTANKLTIGVGYNIDDRGVAELEQAIGRKYDGSITRDEAIKILLQDIDTFESAVHAHFPHYEKLDPIRQRVVLDMAFNLGFRALQFKGTIAAVIAGDYARAKRQMMSSLWAKQVGDGIGGRMDRAERLSEMMFSGEDYVS